MLFNSYEFIFAFLPVVLAVCFVCARTLGPGAAQIWLTAASLYFYASWNVQYLPLLLVSILFNYAVARVLVRTASDERRQVLLLSAVAINLALLGYYKYTNYFLDTLNTVAGTHYSFLELALPLGISFYTFQQLTLLVDISQGTIKSFRFRDFLLFVTFFPHLIAGPIVHHREMMPQFERADYRARWDNLAIGLTLFAVGLFKKAVLADGIATQVAPLFTSAAAGPSTFVFAWAAAIGFVLQMYFDFSGYSEMALGLARMVGIKLPMNFNSPLKATSIIQYWACWHITLTRLYLQPHRRRPHPPSPRCRQAGPQGSRHQAGRLHHADRRAHHHHDVPQRPVARRWQPLPRVRAAPRRLPRHQPCLAPVPSPLLGRHRQP